MSKKKKPQSKKPSQMFKWVLIVFGILLTAVFFIIMAWLRREEPTIVSRYVLIWVWGLLIAALIAVWGFIDGKIVWPEVILLLLLMSALAGVVKRSWSTPLQPIEISLPGTPTPQPIEISLPVTKITVGDNSLYPSQLVDLIVYRSDGTSTPDYDPAVVVQVVDIRGEGESRALVVRVPADQVVDLQQAAAAMNARILYRELPGTPTPTPTPTPTLSPTPTSSPAPAPALPSTYFELPATLVKPRLNNLDPGSAYKMVLVTERQEVTAPGNVVIDFNANSYNVTFLSFLNANGEAFDVYDKDNTTEILIAVHNENITGIATGLASAKSILLLEEWPTATPTAVPGN